MGAIPDRAQQWLVSEFNFRATAAGRREVSVVLATPIFGQIATQRYAHHTQAAREDYQLRTSFFDSLPAAKAGARDALRQPYPPAAGQ